MFGADWMKNYHEQIVDLLADDIRVLIYAGDCDFICNFLGNKKWTLELDWDGKVEFQNAADTPWMVDGVEGGLSKSYEGFTFLQVYDAGHMVPMDQGYRSLVMLNMFIQNIPFPKSALK
jgi:cathepsin A (carboxypeptidase C)